MGVGARTGMRLVIILGLVSLFADMTYESARSISGPYMALLGASATVVGVVSGAGELFGYGVRYLSGRLTDQTGRYWTLTLLGYVTNLLAIPLLALAGRWEIAAVLLVIERLGKAIRNPARDAILSHATHEMGRGWGFGVHRAMDQTGAILGPLIMSAILWSKHDYHTAFAVLAIPALLALVCLAIGAFIYPNPRDLEVKVYKPEIHGRKDIFWIYLAGAALLGAGFVDFPLIAYHFKKTGVALDAWIPIFYSAAMGAEALAALAIGRLFDRFRLLALGGGAFLAAFFVPLVFLAGGIGPWVGMVLWGMGMGSQESAMKAAIAEMTPADKRGSVYGLFNMLYGVAWFAGSALMGFLYDRSLIGLVIFSLGAQLLALPFIIVAGRKLQAAHQAA